MFVQFDFSVLVSAVLDYLILKSNNMEGDTIVLILALNCANSLKTTANLYYLLGLEAVFFGVEIFMPNYYIHKNTIQYNTIQYNTIQYKFYMLLLLYTGYK